MEKDNWQNRITFNQEEGKFEFDGVVVSDEEDLEFVIQTIKSILFEVKQNDKNKPCG